MERCGWLWTRHPLGQLVMRFSSNFRSWDAMWSCAVISDGVVARIVRSLAQFANPSFGNLDHCYDLLALAHRPALSVYLLLRRHQGHANLATALQTPAAVGHVLTFSLGSLGVTQWWGRAYLTGTTDEFTFTPFSYFLVSKLVTSFL